MRRTLAFLCLFTVTGIFAGCGGADNSNQGNSNSTRNGVVETNSNMSPRMNGNSVPSNTAVVTNNNGNDNTAGIKSTNSNNSNNSNHSNSNNSNRSNSNNSNHSNGNNSNH